MLKFIKKVFGKEEEAAQAAATAKAAGGTAVASPEKSHPAIEAVQKEEAKAEKKKQSLEDQLNSELDKLPSGILSQIKDPAIRQKILDLAKRMVADGVDLKSEKQIKSWLRNHPEMTYGAGAPKVETFRREEPKVGRNDPCPCGSGQKYKKCCGKDK